MRRTIAHVSLVERDDDGAIDVCSKKARFALVEDTDLPEPDKLVDFTSGGAHARASKP